MKTEAHAVRSIASLLHDPARRSELFDALPSLVWCADGQGGCSFVNQAWKDFTGRNPYEKDLGRVWALKSKGDTYLQADAAVGERPPSGSRAEKLTPRKSVGPCRPSSNPSTVDNATFDSRGRLSTTPQSEADSYTSSFPFR